MRGQGDSTVGRMNHDHVAGDVLATPQLASSAKEGAAAACSRMSDGRKGVGSTRPLSKALRSQCLCVLPGCCFEHSFELSLPLAWTLGHSFASECVALCVDWSML